MTLSISSLHSLFGARVDGFDPASLDAATARELRDATDRYGLLLIRDLGFDDGELADLASQFGPLQNLSGSPDVTRHVIRLSNLTDEGAIKPASDMSRARHEANKLWHADSTFLSPGASYSFLLARTVPAHGGNTDFCDMRAAWEMLPPAIQHRLAPLYSDHSMEHSWKLTGFDLESVGGQPMPAVRRRLAPLHEPSDRTALMIPSHVARVEGMDEPEWLALQDELTAMTATPDRIYSHEWRPGDLLIWDNRCMLHRATVYADQSEPRDLSSCRVVDTSDTGAHVSLE